MLLLSLLDRLSSSVSMLDSRFLDLVLVLSFLVVLVESSKESSSSSSSRTVVGTTKSSLLLHSVDGVGDVESFLEGGDSWRATFSVSGSSDGLEKRRVERHGCCGRRLEVLEVLGSDGLGRRLLLFVCEENKRERSAEVDETSSTDEGGKKETNVAPRVSEELVDGVPLRGIDAEKMSDEILGCDRDVVPPRREEGVVTSSDLLGQDGDGLVVERTVRKEQRASRVSSTLRDCRTARER